MTPHPRRRIPPALALIALASAVAAPAAVGTDGNLYPQGSGAFTTGSMLSASQPNPSVLQLNAPATTAAPTGPQFTMGWGCPVPGSEIASVQWSALRYAAPSHAGLQVLANGHPVWAEGDVGMPQSPRADAATDWGCPAARATCSCSWSRASGASSTRGCGGSVVPAPSSVTSHRRPHRW